MNKRDLDQWTIEEWGKYDFPTDAKLHGYQECACCGDFVEAGELSEIGHCSYCTNELGEGERAKDE